MNRQLDHQIDQLQISPLSSNHGFANGFGLFGNVTGNMYINSLLMMIFMPLFTSISGKLVDFTISTLKTIGEIILLLVTRFTDKYYKHNDYMVEIEIFSSCDSVIKTTRFGNAILWYFKQNNIHISKKYAFCFYDFVKNTNSLPTDTNIPGYGYPVKLPSKSPDIPMSVDKKRYSLIPIPVKFEKKLKDTLKSKNGGYEKHEELNDEQDKNTEFTYLENDIFVSIARRNKKGTRGLYDTYSYDNTANDGANVLLILKSDRGLDHIDQYITNIGKQYEKYIENMNDRFHGRMFLMNMGSGYPSQHMMGTEYMGQMSTHNNATIAYTEYKYDKTQTFENLFFTDKQSMITQLDRLKDEDYFHVRGLKRKLALLICGPPGVGKTCCVNAIANYTKRAIVCIPISRVKSSVDIENILYCNNYNNEILENKDKIILFDEIDTFANINMVKQEKRKEHAKQKKTKKKNNNNDDTNNEDNESEEDEGNRISDPFNVGVFLSLLDGVNDQDNMIIIATANNLSSLEPSLYRDGRLKLTELSYVGREEIKQMIELYNTTRLTDGQISRIRDDKIIQNLTIKTLCIDRMSKDPNDIDRLIDKINELEETPNYAEYAKMMTWHKNQMKLLSENTKKTYRQDHTGTEFLIKETLDSNPCDMAVYDFPVALDQ